MSKRDPVILPIREIARKYARHPNTVHKTWTRAQLPFFPVEIVDRGGRRRTVLGIERAMFEAFLMAGGLPRRVSSIALGREIKKRFRIED